MDKLPINNTPKSATPTTQENKAPTTSTGMLVGAFIILVVVVVMLVQIDLTDFNAILSLGTNFFVLLVCNFGMYVNQFDSGMGVGKQSNTYINATTKYANLKQEVVNEGIDYRMNEFCVWYIKEELRGARSSLLAASGVSYATYEPYIGMDSETILGTEGLSEQQKTAIISANELKPIVLNPDMIMQRESVSKRRTKPKRTPTFKRYTKVSFRLVRLFVNAALISAVSFNVFIDPSLATLAATAFKVLFVVLNGVAGYKEGLTNITVDTVDYIGEQIDYLNQFIAWAKREEEKKEVI